MLSSVVSEVQRLYKSVMYIDKKCPFYLLGISSVFDSKGMWILQGGILRPVAEGLWTRAQRMNYCDFFLFVCFLSKKKSVTGFLNKLCNGFRLRLEGEKNQVLFINTN